MSENQITKRHTNIKHMKRSTLYKSRQSGQIIITAVIFFLSVSLIVLIGITSPIAFQIRNAADFTQTKQGYIGADNLNEEALYRLNRGRSLPGNLVLSFSQSTSSATIVSSNGAWEVVSTGISGLFSRKSKAVFSQGQGVSLIYGLQVGTGGVDMSGGAGIIGNLFSNGEVVGSGGPYVTGSVFASNVSEPYLDQTSVGQIPSSSVINFGGQLDSSNPNPNDFAQSFTVSTTTPISMVRFHMKRHASVWMNNITVRVTNDAVSRPGGTTLASATIDHSAVPTTYSYITVPFDTRPTLVPGTTYWLVMDTSNTWSSFYSVSASSSVYSSGSSRLGSWSSSGGGTWSNTSPSTLDAYFDVFAGGQTGLISGVIVQGGDAKAFRIQNSTIAGIPYCQSGSGNNKSCNTSQATPSQVEYPIKDTNIETWKDEASAGSVRGSWSIGGNTATSTTGAMRINGDLTVGSGAVLTLGGTLYVTGNINMSGSGRIQIANSFGNRPLAVVVDGLTTMTGGSLVTGNGGNRSYALLVSTNRCPNVAGCSGNNAISASGGTGSVVLIAQEGTISFSGGTSAKSAVARKMIMSGGTTLNYETGLSDLDFTSGPSGAWTVESWREVAD